MEDRELWGENTIRSGKSIVATLLCLCLCLYLPIVTNIVNTLDMPTNSRC